MMQSIREELKRTDIHITNLFPGGVDSAFWDTIDLKVQRKRMIQAEKAAKAIWFLCQQPGSGVMSEMVLKPLNRQVINYCLFRVGSETLYLRATHHLC